MNVRIGNDIRLNVTLGSPDINMTNIKHLRCYLANMTQKEVEHCDWDWHCGHGCHCCNEPKRYPVEPYCHHHCPGKYLLHACGKPSYYAHPANCYRSGYTCDPAFGPALMPKPCCCCHCHRHKCGNCHTCCGKFCGHCCHEHYEHLDGHYMGCSHCNCCCDDHVGKCCNHDLDCIDLDYKYLTDTNLVESINKIQCYFPAQDQYLCGAYKFVVVMTVYEPGWGCRNLHTYTFDYGIVFNLVEDGNVTGVVEIDLGGDNTHTVPVSPDDQPTQPEPINETMGGFIFFNPNANIQQSALENEAMMETVFTTTGVQNTTGDAAFLYVVTKKPVNKIMSSFGIPFTLVGNIGEYYIYRSGNKVVPGFSDKVTVKEA